MVMQWQQEICVHGILEEDPEHSRRAGVPGPPSGRKGKHPAESVDMPWPLCPLWSISCPEDQAALAPRVSRIDRWELDTGCPEILDSRSQTVAYQLGQQ